MTNPYLRTTLDEKSVSTVFEEHLVGYPEMFSGQSDEEVLISLIEMYNNVVMALFSSGNTET